MRTTFLLKFAFLVTFAFLAVSCQDNFDEWNDTNQRTISFKISTEDFFRDYLTMYNGIYTKGLYFPLESSYRFRISCYCYDKHDSLIQYKHYLSNDAREVLLHLRHLKKEQEYRFDFFCDAVRYDKTVDYYESWFQLGTNNINTFYLFCFQPDSVHSHNIVKHATVYAAPNNNTVPIALNPITINGYVVFSNMQDVEMLDGYYEYNESFYLNGMSGRRRSAHSYKYLPNGKKQIVIPLTMGAISDTLFIKVKRVMLSNIDSTFIEILNPENNCFVSEIDCKTLKQKLCVY